jgi:hypothetical protein
LEVQLSGWTRVSPVLSSNQVEGLRTLYILLKLAIHWRRLPETVSRS